MRQNKDGKRLTDMAVDECPTCKGPVEVITEDDVVKYKSLVSESLYSLAFGLRQRDSKILKGQRENKRLKLNYNRIFKKLELSRIALSSAANFYRKSFDSGRLIKSLSPSQIVDTVIKSFEKASAKLNKNPNREHSRTDVRGLNAFVYNIPTTSQNYYCPSCKKELFSSKDRPLDFTLVECECGVTLTVPGEKNNEPTEDI